MAKRKRDSPMKVAVTAALLLLVGCGFAFIIAPNDRSRVAWFVIGCGTAGFSYRLWCSIREMNRRRRDGSNRK